MKIFTKLLLIMLVMTSLLFTSLYLLLQWSFDQGMLDYVNEREIKSLEQVSINIKKVYLEIDDLNKFVKNNHWWHTILQKSSNGETLNKQSIEAMISKEGSFIQRGPPRRFNRPPIQQNIERRGPPPFPRDANGSNNRRPLPDGADPSRPPGELNNIDRASDRKPSLLDINKDVIMGEYRADFHLLPLKINEQLIGYLALPPKTQLTSPFDLAFSANQQTTWLFILFGLFSITFIVVVVLSRYLVKRIQVLTQATSQLTNGDFNIKLLATGQDELTSLARDFNDLAKTLSNNDVTRKAWLADVSHELRTPLAIVKGEIEALQDGIRPVTPENLESLAEEVNHLQKLINDLSQLTNADIGALNYQKSSHDIIYLLQQNIDRRALSITQAGFNLSTNLTDTVMNVWLDDTRIHQLFDNLLTNSLKYTDAPGIIVINAYKESKDVIITFEDSSPSVPEEAIGKLFDHLFRVENSRNRKTGGSGLGLALCEKIVQAHQGEISAYISPQGGLGIKINIPLI